MIEISFAIGCIIAILMIIAWNNSSFEDRVIKRLDRIIKMLEKEEVSDEQD